MTESCGVTALINVVHALKWGPHADSSMSTLKKKKKSDTLSTPDMSPEALEQKAVLKHG